MPLAIFFITRLIDLYTLLVFVWVLGSWFPQWRYQEWFRFVASLVEPYLNLFRGMRLQAGMMDLTPMVAVFMLYLLRMAIVAAAGGGMAWH